MSDSEHAHRKALGGLLTQRLRWGLSMRGAVVSIFLFLAACCGFILGIYPFLAVTSRADSTVLVVEGWIRDHAIQSAFEEFKSGGYQRIFTTGGPIEGSYSNDYNTSASIGAGRLRNLGVPPGAIQMIPAKAVEKDRTYTAALALRDWLRQNDPSIRAVTVITQDVHARRTRLLFQEALGSDIQVGIISVPNTDYNPARWWRYSEGVRDTISETIAYVYARLLFNPRRNNPSPLETRTAPP